jgi:alpha-glucoside transport system substrate-binding protein
MMHARLTTFLVVAALAAAGLSACTAAAQAVSVTVMAPWTGQEPGTEGYEFRQVLAKFTADTGIEVEYQDTRAMSQVLVSNVEAGRPPDVAILSSLGDLASYSRSGQLYALDEVVSEEQRKAFPSSWLLPQNIDGVTHIYTVPIKANLKSMIWYRQPNPALAEFRTWEEFLSHSRTIAAGGVAPWCMGLGDGASSGWPATDFMEDILLSEFGPQTYQNWAAGNLAWGSKEMADTWTTWGAIATDEALTLGGRKGLILTDFFDAGRSMFKSPPGCLMEHQASFAMSFYRNFGDGSRSAPEPGDDFDFVPFPPSSNRLSDNPPVVASADFAGMFNDTPQARRLMNFLATDEGQGVWPAIPGAGAFTVNENVNPDQYQDDISTRIAKTLRDARDLCLDAADLMPATMRNAFYRAILYYLTDPTTLPSILDQLDHIRADIPEEDWLDLPCRR